MNYRRLQAKQIREKASQLAHDRPHPNHANNGEEFLYRTPDNKPSHIANFTKGLPHNVSDGSLNNPDDYHQFVLGIQSGDAKDFERTPLGPVKNPDGTPKWESAMAKAASAEVRAWESAGAGHTFDLQGPDAQAVTMPPVPNLKSKELTVEMAEVYLMALLRDEPFEAFRTGGATSAKVTEAIAILNDLDFFDCMIKEHLTPAEAQRQRKNLTKQTLFRGLAPGDDEGPYLSQFLLLGNGGINSNDSINNPEDGQLTYGALRIDQRVRKATPNLDYMTTYEQWIDTQNGADLRGLESYEPAPNGYRFITTPRDLATYVHYDALYEAYLNACLFLLAIGAPFDPGLPFQQSDKIDKQQGFAQFGGPHILSLVTEVATRALKAVRYQKFNVHRRARPEALAGLIHLYKNDQSIEYLQPIRELTDALSDTDLQFGGQQFLNAVATHNATQNQNADRNADDNATNNRPQFLLPMAFPEGSPMHPAYGAGHATVAGACVTILKAYFDHGYNLAKAIGNVWEPKADGTGLKKVSGVDELTVEGELNKLVSNISIGRDWAGVHYYTDYIESFKIGEQIAIGILEENKLLYSENFTMTVPLLDGTCIRI